MKTAIIIFSILSFVTGVLLLLISFGINWKAILFFVGLGLLCIAAAVAYTVGRRPYGYMGLGDASVMIFFGLVGVLGSYYLFTHELSSPVVLPALSCGFFSMAVLNINNIRDIESDRVAGKFSVPVRVGKENAIRYHWVLLISGLSASMVYTLWQYQSSVQWLFLLSAPLFLMNGMAVARKSPADLDPYLKQMALSTLAFVILFGTGNMMR